MDKNNLGNILYFLRKERGVSQEQLCLGLCTKGAYSKYEYGTQLPDRLLMNAFLQRMGKSVDKLETLLGLEEYHYFIWKRNALAAARQGDMEALRNLLREPEAVSIGINRNLQLQFLHLMESIVADRGEGDMEKSISCLKEAAELTLPGVFLKEFNGYLISIEEMHIFLDLAEALVKSGREAEAMDLLIRLCSYADSHYDDYEAKVKAYPRAVSLLWPLLLQRGRALEGALLCQRAVELLRWQGILYNLARLMEGYLMCSVSMASTEEAVRYRKQLKALRDVYQEYHAERYGMEHTRLFYQNQEMYLIDEMIRGYRSMQSMSQETLSEEICTPETLSRIESGKRSPSRKNFHALMDKLETGHDYYNGRLETDDFLLLEKHKELERAVALKNWSEANQLLRSLKAKVGIGESRSWQSLEITENLILFAERKLSPDEYIHRCEKALNCREEEWREEEFWNRFFTKDMVRLLNGINIALERKGRKEDSIFILEHLLRQFEQSKVRLVDRYASSMIIVGNLSSCYGEAGNLEKCIEMCEKGVKLCLESGRGVRLAKLLGNKAEAINLMANATTKKSQQYFELVYYLSDLMLVHEAADYADTYYRKHYNPDVVWY